VAEAQLVVALKATQMEAILCLALSLQLEVALVVEVVVVCLEALVVAVVTQMAPGVLELQDKAITAVLVEVTPTAAEVVVRVR
jgi:hypothetical protein